MLSGLGGTGGGAAGLGAGVGLDKIVKTFWPISRQKLNGWKLYLEEELKKLREDNKKLIDNEIEEIEKLKKSEIYNAESKFQQEKDRLNDEEHPLNKWSNELDSAREEAKGIREQKPCEDPSFFLLIRETTSFLYFYRCVFPLTLMLNTNVCGSKFSWFFSNIHCK